MTASPPFMSTVPRPCSTPSDLAQRQVGVDRDGVEVPGEHTRDGRPSAVRASTEFSDRIDLQMRRVRTQRGLDRGGQRRLVAGHARDVHQRRGQLDGVAGKIQFSEAR